jgi:hypothetical protein
MTFDAQEDRDRFEDHTPMDETEAEIQGLVNVLTDPKIMADAFADFIDHDTGKKVKNIMEKYLDTVYSEETCDLIMTDLRNEFGNDADAQVTLDSDTTEIEIIVRDVKNRLMKCSSLTLFKNKQVDVLIKYITKSNTKQ